MRSELSCPICNADVPMSGDEKRGDEVFCTYCGAPLTVKGSREDEAELELEDDF
jgi:DNA-directed RNA polymerase subunit RPC12/RpoP